MELIQVDGWFNTFWAEYPKKRDKVAAQRAWKRIKPSYEELSLILQGINRYMASGEWRDPQFIPYPATFLNRRRWEDEIIGGAVQRRAVKEQESVIASAEMPSAPHQIITRYCAYPGCGHTGSWHLNEVKHNRAPNHEFVLASDQGDVAQVSGSISQGRM